MRSFAVDAHDLGTGAYPIRSTDQVVVISHRGYKTYPNAALRRAGDLGCHTVAIVGRDAPDQPASITLRTCANETAGTFSVSYLATLAALAKLVAETFRSQAAGFAAALPDLAGCIEREVWSSYPIHDWVEAFAAQSPILISGFGSDLPTAQEAALKIKEGAWLWTEAMSPEFAIHGTPASYHAGMSAMVLMPNLDDGGRSRLLVDVLTQAGAPDRRDGRRGRRGGRPRLRSAAASAAAAVPVDPPVPPPHRRVGARPGYQPRHAARRPRTVDGCHEEPHAIRSGG